MVMKLRLCRRLNQNNKYKRFITYESGEQFCELPLSEFSLKLF